MQLLNREEFLKLPEGTLYSEYDPHVFGDIRVKLLQAAMRLAMNTEKANAPT